ncbi:MAG TPA: RsmD family RNA methyltransferase [Holophagaceae bacterium]|nr:RsmD family RNA methyltransferase [Holophagaceae bacterium]
MRIIAGSLKGRRLAAPPEGDLRVRPTSDRAREALFSILQRWPQGPFLDLFAGTGAVGLEAFSRGFEPVVCVEQGEPAWGCLEKNLRGTMVRGLRKDASRLPADTFPPQAVVFLDPPYEMAEALWSALAERLRLWTSPEGVLVFETDRRTRLPEAAGWTLADLRDYGANRFHFWTLAQPRGLQVG